MEKICKELRKREKNELEMAGWTQEVGRKRIKSRE